MAMALIQIEDYRKYVREGEQYLRTAVTAAARRKDVFTPEILYNLTAIAIEKFLMGFLMYHGTLADNHTMQDLSNAVEAIAGRQETLAGQLRYLDSFQEICDMDTYNRKAPEPGDIPKILGIGKDVKRFVLSRIDI